MENKMIAKKILISASAAAMAFAPVAASAAPAVERQTAVSKENSELGGTGLIIAILAGLAVIGGIIAAASDDDDTPVSI